MEKMNKYEEFRGYSEIHGVKLQFHQASYHCTGKSDQLVNETDASPGTPLNIQITSDGLRDQILLGYPKKYKT